MKQLLDDLKEQWASLWRDRIDDRVKAEGIASKEYQSLFVDDGEVIIATRDFKPLNFTDILDRHRLSRLPGAVPPHPTVGGWGKFMRNTLNKQQNLRKTKRPAPKLERKESQQPKKDGRGWLHFKMRE
jgi:hypothetical protein